MSTSKNIDKICVVITALTLVLTVLFMFGQNFGITVMATDMPYEKSLFDTSYVHTIDIVADDWDEFIETCENEEYIPCTVVIDGEKYVNVGIRAKGNTSLSTVSSMNSERYSFKIEFDHYESGKTFGGLDKLCLNNLIQDNTMMKDYIAYVLMNSFDVDSPLCSFAYITVNGEDWGLYLAVEGVEDSFLKRNYGNLVGDLYKPDSISAGGGRGNGKDFNMDDFDFGDIDSSAFASSSGVTIPGQSGNITVPTQQGEMTFPEQSGGMTFPGMGEIISGGTFDPTQIMSGGFDDSAKNNLGGNIGGGMGSDDVKLKYSDDDPDSYSNIFDSAKTNVSSTDKKRLIKALKNLNSYENLEDTLDINEVIRYFVVHNFLCNGDSYTGSMIHNYYLYEEDGKLSMIPWDYNLAYGTFQGGNASSTVNTSIDSPVSGGTVDDRPMLGWIFSSTEYTDEYHRLFSEFIEQWFANGELEKLITDTAEMIRPYVEKDPTKFCTIEEFNTGVSAIKSFVDLRAQAVKKQLSGDKTTVDTGSLNLSDMGTMNNGAGGGNMPDNEIGSGGFERGMKDENTGSGAIEPGTPVSSDSVLSSAVQKAALQNAGPATPVAGEQGGQMPDGQMPSDQMGGQNPGGQNGGQQGAQGPGGQMGGQQGDMDPGAQQGGQMPTDQQGGQNPMGSGGMTDFPAANSNGFSFGTSGDGLNWLMVGISVLVLGLGIVIAVKKY